MASRCIQVLRSKTWLSAPCSRPSSQGTSGATPAPFTPQHTPVRHATTTETGIILEEPKREKSGMLSSGGGFRDPVEAEKG
ncbi:hypothetical protein TCAL_16496 [Tigriopus californicus]|uniref:Uncharacterized protein n=1 Tax=Tigriopus californicus TaxID=6832 RepID=A0A553NS68_TIGCA|nr:hypothetical protein TCAL_16496 [Tigriopus californicus]